MCVKRNAGGVERWCSLDAVLGCRLQGGSCPDHDGCHLEPKWLRTSWCRAKVRFLVVCLLWLQLGVDLCVGEQRSIVRATDTRSVVRGLGHVPFPVKTLHVRISWSDSTCHGESVTSFVHKASHSDITAYGCGCPFLCWYFARRPEFKVAVDLAQSSPSTCGV